MSKEVLLVIQIILGLALVLLILMQSKGSGLGSTFGSNMAFYSTRRGAEKVVFISTIIVAFLFFATCLVGVMIR